MPQSVGNPLQTPTGRKTNSLCVSGITSGRHGFQVLAQDIQRNKPRCFLGLFFFFTLLVFIPQLYLRLTMRSTDTLRRTNQMFFYLFSGIQRQDLESMSHMDQRTIFRDQHPTMRAMQAHSARTVVLEPPPCKKTPLEYSKPLLTSTFYTSAVNYTCTLFLSV